MAKDMSNIYADMLTKELVALRKKHMEAYQAYLSVPTRKGRLEAARRKDLLEQINNELAARISSFNIFV